MELSTGKKFKEEMVMCMMDKTLAKKIDELKKLKDEQDILEAKMSGLKDELKGYLEEKGIDEYSFIYEDKKYKFSNKTTTQMRFDSKWFQQDYKELYESYKKASPITKFLFS